jgi:hypothetical protein
MSCAAETMASSGFEENSNFISSVSVQNPSKLLFHSLKDFWQNSTIDFLKVASWGNHIFKSCNYSRS